MKKQAFCIMAHKNPEQLNLLISLLDYSMSDIYLHIDKKSNIKDEDIVHPKISNLYFVPRNDIRWGDVSQVKTEIELYEATQNSSQEYSFVHLLSGEDLPIKNIKEIIEYFDANPNTEFIDCSDYPEQIKRLQYYWLFTRHMRGNILYKVIRHSAIALQKVLHIDRFKGKNIDFKYGSSWISATNKAIKCIISEYHKMESTFNYTVSGDEVYKQIILNKNGFTFSPKGNLRYLQFPPHSSSPIIFKTENYDEIMNSGCLFARKFDNNIDASIINKIVEHIKS